MAPTNEAFAKLDPATVESLKQPENVDQLKDILTYHVIPGMVMSSAVTDGQVVDMVNGKTTTIKTDPTPMINDANIIDFDIPASNGMIHVIDTVIMPPTDDASVETVTSAPGEMDTDMMDGNTTAPASTGTPAPATTSGAASVSAFAGLAAAAVMAFML